MMNCWPYITSNPKLLLHDLWSSTLNNDIIVETAGKCKEVIFAWGTFKVVSKLGRDKELQKMFPNAKCFGHNKNGTPWHPRALIYNGKLKEPQLIPYNKPLW